MKKKTYTLLFNVDVTYIGENPWKRKEDILAKNIQETLSTMTGAKVEVSCPEMQHGVIEAPEWRSFTQTSNTEPIKKE